MADLGDLIAGRLVARDNRFRATVLVDGELHRAHVPNSGRLRELLVPDAIVHLRPAARAGRVTPYDLVLVEYLGHPVCVDARWPPRLIVEAWERDQLPPFARYDRVRAEVVHGDSRLDLRFDSPAGDVCWTEAKSVTLVDGGVAQFPDAPTERGRRHLNELAHLAEQGICAAVVFVVQRVDAIAFAPRDRTDPEFGQALRAARDAGVQVLAYPCEVNTRQVTLIPRPLPHWF